MGKLRETILFDEGAAYRLIRRNGNPARVEIVLGPDRSRHIPAHGAHWHYHRAMELTLITAGVSTCFVADQFSKFVPGDIIVLGENIPHYWIHPHGARGLAVQWEFPLEHGIWDFAETKPLRPFADRARCGLLIRGNTASLARSRLEQLTATAGLERLAGLLQLLHGLATAPKTDVQTLSQRPFDLSGTDEHEEAIQRALSYIHANYREPIMLSDLLAITGMSRATFSRQFLRRSGKPFSTFTNEVRLRAVCTELRGTSKAISNIALDHGFTQLTFFNRLFRREFGLSPTDYRAQGAAGDPFPRHTAA